MRRYWTDLMLVTSHCYPMRRNQPGAPRPAPQTSSEDASFASPSFLSVFRDGAPFRLVTSWRRESIYFPFILNFKADIVVKATGDSRRNRGILKVFKSWTLNSSRSRIWNGGEVVWENKHSVAVNVSCRGVRGWKGVEGAAARSTDRAAKTASVCWERALRSRWRSKKDAQLVLRKRNYTATSRWCCWLPLETKRDTH